VLFFGPPGLGKTTLSNIIATELGVKMRQTSGPVLERAGDLAAVLTNLEPHDVLFIDEIHRLSPPAARTVKLSLPPFTLVGATTRAGLLTSPLRDRFGIVQRLEYYNEQDLSKIIQRSATILELETEDEGVKTIAKRSRGTPRIANRLLRRVRDYAQVKGDGTISKDIAVHALDMFLIQQGFMMRTTRGRMVTNKCWLHFGINMPEKFKKETQSPDSKPAPQKSLFDE